VSATDESAGLLRVGRAKEDPTTSCQLTRCLGSDRVTMVWIDIGKPFFHTTRGLGSPSTRLPGASTSPL